MTTLLERPAIRPRAEAALQAWIGGALEAEFGAFQAAVHRCPDAQMSVQPPVGHSVAWHALHIMDWTRCMIQWDLPGVDPKLTYGYLGFEDEDWAKAVTGPTLADEHDPAERIRTVLDMVFDEALDAIRHAPLERFRPDAMWTTLKQPRPVLDGLMYHLRHIAYHRGQIALTLKTTSP